MLSIITLPSATTTLAQLGDYSKPMFEEFLPIALSVAGTIIGVLLVLFFVRIFYRGIRHLYLGGKTGDYDSDTFKNYINKKHWWSKDDDWD